MNNINKIVYRHENAQLDDQRNWLKKNTKLTHVLKCILLIKCHASIAKYDIFGVVSQQTQWKFQTKAIQCLYSIIVL